MKYCIVTGITGTLGECVSKSLHDDGYFVIGLSRKKCDYANYNIICDFENFETEKVKTELIKFFDCQNEIESIDFVHSAGYYEKEIKGDMNFNETLCKKIYSINTFSFYLVVNILVVLCEKYNVKSSVVAVSSNLTSKKNKFTTLYISSKMALEGMTQSFAQTYGNLNMRFNSVCPGMFASNMNKYFVPSEFENNTPLKRLGKVEDIAQAIMFFISDKSSCVTANKIIVDGGGSNGY